MRFGQDRFDEIDAQAEAEGWPPGWRMEHDAREANRQAVLSGRMGQDLWVFAYGSLIWDPAVHVDEYRYGALAGTGVFACGSKAGAAAMNGQD